MTVTRPKLSITRHARTIDDVVPLPQIEQGMDRTRRGGAEREMVDGFRRDAHASGRARGADEGTIAACTNGDGREVQIAAFLDPVRGMLDLDDDGVADVAAFTRRLLAGGRPERGSQRAAVRDFDL